MLNPINILSKTTTKNWFYARCFENKFFSYSFFKIDIAKNLDGFKYESRERERERDKGWWQILNSFCTNS